VIGEGDITIIELLRCLEAGQDPASVDGIGYFKNDELYFSAVRPVVENIDKIPPPDWSLFNIEVYIDSQSEAMHDYIPSSMKEDLRVIPINTARGCPFNCTFCYHVFKRALSQPFPGSYC